MSHETRRRVILIGVALIVVALVLGSVGCSSTSGNGDDADALSPALYTQAMGDICDATTQRLDVLPVPPDEISRTDWAGEVARALRDEAAAFDEIDVGDARRTDHASFVENTEGQAASWLALGEALAVAEPDGPTISDLTTEISELTLGRNDLADEMGLAGCRARELS
jgi:hypothetical protein